MCKYCAFLFHAYAEQVAVHVANTIILSYFDKYVDPHKIPSDVSLDLQCY